MNVAKCIYLEICINEHKDYKGKKDFINLKFANMYWTMVTE